MTWENILTRALFVFVCVGICWGVVLAVGVGFVLPVMAMAKAIDWLLGLSC